MDKRPVGHFPCGLYWCRIADEPGRWVVTQILADPAGDAEWRLTATVDLERATADGAPTLELTSLAPAVP